MIPPNLFFQIYPPLPEQNDCTPPKCGELSQYTDSAHTEVEDLSSRCMNGSNVYDRCGHDISQLHPPIIRQRIKTDEGKKEIFRGFNDALNTFYLRLYGVGHIVKDHSDSERGNPLPPHGLLFPISRKGSFICTIPQTE